MPFLCPHFDELNTHQLYQIYKLRSKVFVVEQNCAYQDVDEKDPLAIHCLLIEDSELAAYCRILPPGVSYAECAIGRVVVDPVFRRKGLGRELMKLCITKTRELFKNQEIVISAQTYLTRFYEELGFVPEGTEYLEDAIPHIQMRLKN
jgi:ElaA protein